MGLLEVRMYVEAKSTKLFTCFVALLFLVVCLSALGQKGLALGLMAPPALKSSHPALLGHGNARIYTDLHSIRLQPGRLRGVGARNNLVRRHFGRNASDAQVSRDKKRSKTASIFYPQKYEACLKSKVLAPGIVYRYFKGPLAINVLDIDTVQAGIGIRPILASDGFNSLEQISQQAKSSHALAAINANYFKKNGTPLGTLILNGEWVAGPIYDRVSFGITKTGAMRVDRVKLTGLLTSGNPLVPSVQIDNINQPRRTGSRLVIYSRRWGSSVRLPYEGCLLSISASGEILDKSTQYMSIPPGGYVLSDSKGGPASKLGLGDMVKLSWRTDPTGWADVVQAVSGGPLLIRDGKLFVDLKDESFRGGWTGCHIKARTACGVTSDQHLILVTVEGPHTLWDLAKFLHGLGAVDALNLDGGGSTGMFVNGSTVTQSRRKVASAIGIFSKVVAFDNQNVAAHSKPVDLIDFADTSSFTVSDQALQGLGGDGLVAGR